MKSKNILKGLFFFLAIQFAFSSCEEFLDQSPDAVAFTEEQVFTDYSLSQKYIDQLLVYGSFFDDNDMLATTPDNYFGKRTYGTREKLSDNLIPNTQYGWISGNGFRIGNGATTNGASPYWNESDYQRFAAFWKAIRITNMSIGNVDKIKDVTPEQKNQILGHAYFLRGHFYFMLLQGWGGMPWITSPLDPSENMDFKRDSYTVTAQNIATSFDSAAMYLPMVVSNADWGRPTKMAALACKAKALLWAACPYANPANDKKLWQDAAVAAGKAIYKAENSGYYGLVNLSNWKNMFIDVNEEALREVIFGRVLNNFSFGFGPYYTCPKSVAFGSNTVGCESPTENLAQCFGWSNGEPVDPGSAEYKSKPFTGDGVTHTGRDPRFDISIMHNESSVAAVQKLGRTVQIWNASYNNVAAQELALTSGNPTPGWTFTGYYNNKLYSDAMPTHGRSTVMWNIIRLADLYLYYAEAANRAWGPTVSPQGISGFSLTAVQSLNKIRARANMPAYDNSKPWLTIGSWDQFEKVIRNETRIETAFEDKRFYDLRRWDLMTDPATTGPTSQLGLYITRTAATTFDYKVVVLPDASTQQFKWQDRHKLFPINPANTYLGPNFKQNPGW
jgi:starch-binding outer membrane protein, SusD/RagB family